MKSLWAYMLGINLEPFDGRQACTSLACSKDFVFMRSENWGKEGGHELH